ncbi:short-chain alcohol dehydrogenase [Marasmius sp. AFHP31]|nr:short-chain alcohol dehydrogenase [Marasmius sp. AFHP31]
MKGVDKRVDKLPGKIEAESKDRHSVGLVLPCLVDVQNVRRRPEQATSSVEATRQKVGGLHYVGIFTISLPVNFVQFEPLRLFLGVGINAGRCTYCLASPNSTTTEMGVLLDYLAQSFPPKSKFNVEDIPDLTGKVIVVTGGNTGIGYETIKALLPKNAKVYMASRSEDKAKVAISWLKKETGKETHFLQVDLSDMESIRRATDEFKSKETELHVLFNNAGVMIPPFEKLTAQGFDLQFGTNVMGPYLFTKRLLPLLLKGSQSSSDHKARIVNTSSSAQMFTNTIDLAAAKDGPARTQAGNGKLYMYSKFVSMPVHELEYAYSYHEYQGIVVLSNEFARRYGEQGIVSTSLNPGNLKTDLQRDTPKIFMLLFGWLFSPAPYGALTQLWAGVSPDTADMNGKYLIPWARVGKTRPETTDPKIGAELWKFLETETQE